MYKVKHEIMDDYTPEIVKKMRPYRLTVTDSFRNLKMEADDIPCFLVGYEDHYEFILDLGDGYEATLIVSEDTVENRPEYFRFIKNKTD